MSIESVEIDDVPDWMRVLYRAVRGLRYGSVEVLVHDGRVVQVETRQKVRFAEGRPLDARRRAEDRDTAREADE